MILDSCFLKALLFKNPKKYFQTSDHILIIFFRFSIIYSQGGNKNEESKRNSKTSLPKKISSDRY